MARLFLFAMLACMLAPVVAAQTSAPDLTARSEALQEETGTPAFGLVVMRGGVIEADIAVGERAIRSGVAAQPGDLWHLGSITKSMTATLVARLVEQGVVSWDTTIGEVFGEVIPEMDPAWEAVSFRELLTHRSGLAANIAMTKFLGYDRFSADARPDRLDYATFMLTRAPRHEPGTTYEYSNAGFIIAGAMLEQITGERWEDLITREVFMPLGLESAGFGPPGSVDVIDQPRGHQPVFLMWGRKPVPPVPMADNPEVLGPAGRVHMSLTDLATYGRVHITGLAPDGSVFLSAESLEVLHTPPAGEYAMGWVVSPPGSFPSGLWHNGSNTVNYAELYVDAASDTVIAMAANDYDVGALGPAMQALARELIPSGAD